MSTSARPSGVGVWSVLAVIGASVPTGYLVAHFSVPVTQNRYFPWIVGRTLGLAAYVTLMTLLVLGTWLRHPWRHRWPLLHPEARLRMHSALGAATVLLVGGHVAALASDRYAGVAWPGTLVPGTSSYRPVAVTLGVLALYFLVAVTATAAWGGTVVGRHWLVVHRLATPTALLIWLHGVLAGSDTPRLRLFYAATGLFVAVVMVTRVLVGSPTGVGPSTVRERSPARARLGAVPPQGLGTGR